jgi:hypothetical protein
LSRSDDREHLQQYANELCEQAAKLEASLAPVQQPVTHEQRQVQQQKAEEPDSEKGKT